jgi:hypothetical protein
MAAVAQASEPAAGAVGAEPEETAAMPLPAAVGAVGALEVTAQLDNRTILAAVVAAAAATMARVDYPQALLHQQTAVQVQAVEEKAIW